jgi:hypothetical protein
MAPKLGMTAAKRPKSTLPNGQIGVVVGKLVAGGAADRAGLKDGDVIVKVGRTAIQSLDEWKEISATWLAGECVTFTLLDQSADPSIAQPAIPVNSSLKRVFEVGTTGKQNTLEWVRTLRSIAKLKYAKIPVDDV